MSSREIENVIRSLPMNKAPGHDKIPIRVIKDSLPAILSPITSIVNASLCSTCQFPSSWKKAEVLPVLKEGDHEEAENNRPISLLPVLSKYANGTISIESADALFSFKWETFFEAKRKQKRPF